MCLRQHLNSGVPGSLNLPHHPQTDWGKGFLLFHISLRADLKSGRRVFLTLRPGTLITVPPISLNVFILKGVLQLKK